MRRDFVFAIMLSLLIHGGFAAISEFWKKGPPEIKHPPKDVVVTIPMPPLELEKPEPVEAKKEEASKPDLSPPKTPDYPQAVTDRQIVQPMQPPSPNLNTNVVVTIPVTSGPGMGDGSSTLYRLVDLDQQPTPTFQSRPVYPFEMRHAGTTGQVVVAFVVDATGNVHGVSAVSSTQREFEAAAVQAVSKWKFKPGRKAGVAVATRMQVPIVFSISEDQE